MGAHDVEVPPSGGARLTSCFSGAARRRLLTDDRLPQTKLQGRGSRLLPDRAKAKLHAEMAEPGSGS